jgi:TonB family protein
MRHAVPLTLLLLLVGCASTPRECARQASTPDASVPQYQSFKAYGVAGARLDAGQAEQALIARANAGVLQQTASHFDHPVHLLAAPMPAMPPNEIITGHAGKVVVAIVFGESGLVESATASEASSEGLKQAALAAVSRWRIAPVTKGGKPAKVAVRQEFNFEISDDRSHWQILDDSSPTQWVYIDPGAFERDGPRVSYTTATTFQRPQVIGGLVVGWMITHSVVDCERHVSAPSFYAWYRKGDRVTQPLSMKTIPPDQLVYSPIVPNSLGDREAKLACNVR